MDKGGKVLFALENKVPIGTIAIVRHSRNVAELSKIAVETSKRRQGVARLLVEYAINYCKLKRYKKIIVVTNSTLKAAINLYKKYGFVNYPLEPKLKMLYGSRANLYFELRLN